MDADRSLVEEDLRGIVAGEVLCADATRALYATDGSLFEVRPLAVVRPRTAEDVAATVAWAAERGIPVHARGAGTGIAGGSLGPGIVVDCSRFLRRIVRIDRDGETARVQAGVVAARLEAHLARFGFTFGPDPAAAGVTTVGGMIGRNASGSRFPRHGAVRGRIVSMQAVLADGSIVELQRMPAEPRDGGGPLASLAARVAATLDAARDTIARHQPPGRASHGGYGLHDVLVDGMVDLPRLLCGSEGTLAIVTEATVRVVPAEDEAAVGLLFFDSLDRAAEAALGLRALGPAALDLFDKRHLALARGTKPAFDVLIPPAAEAALLVEFAGPDAAACAGRLDEALALAQRPRSACIDVRRAEDADDAAFFWELSRSLVATLAGVRGAERPVPFVEDIVVPPPVVPDFLRRLRGALQEAGFTAMIFGHVGHGQLHVRPYADPADPGTQPRLHALAETLYGEAIAVGGTFGGELGLGLSRSPFFARLFPELNAVSVEVKRILDPGGVLNPGKVVSAPEAAAFRAAAPRPAAAAGPAPLPLPVLSWEPDTLAAEVAACNGCGSCRTEGALVRMCPRFRERPAEEASPRAKATLAAALLAGSIEPQVVGSAAARAVAETCFNCHQCRFECAAGVDVPALVMELKAAHVAAGGVPFESWLLSRVDLLSAWGGALRPLANRALANPQARWVLEKTLGIARGRKLPPFSGNTLLRWAARRGLTRPSRRSGPRVLYFLDTYARRHDPLLGQAFVGILERHGVGVFVDPRQGPSGMPLVSAGDLDAARRLARRNVRVLSEAVRLGYRIVCTEPAAVTCLTHDYPLLLEDDEEAHRVAAATCDATTYLLEMHREGRLRLDFSPLPARIHYHAPCHARNGAAIAPAEHLLRLVPGLALRAANKGCSGMAGTFGLARTNYRASLRIGLGLASALRGDVEAGATECSACRLQMEQGTTKPTVHPVKLLAKAYGLLAGPAPHGLDGILTTPSGRLTTS